MLGDFITRILVLVLGYAYPAFECYKTIEKNRVEIEELRFWCQYWILVALVTVFERVGDIFVSWLPMYGELKLALFIYLWYPQTKGTGYVYGSILKPYMEKHEKDIDRSIKEFRARAWDLSIYYGQNFTQLSQTTIFHVLDYLSSQVGKLKQPSLQRAESKETSPALPSPPQSGIFRRNKQPSDRKRPPVPPPAPSFSDGSVVKSAKSEPIQTHLPEQTQLVSAEDEPALDQDLDNPNQLHNGSPVAGLKFRRTKSIH